VGVARLRNLGQDDPAAWLLIPVLGLMISAAMLTAIVYALTPDERGMPGTTRVSRWCRTGWGAGAGGDRRAAAGRCHPDGHAWPMAVRSIFEWELHRADPTPPGCTQR
jgi:hypothetical protein